MQTFFVTTNEAETNFSESISWVSMNCECGESYGYVSEKHNCQIVVCNICHENASYQERYF